MIEKLFLVSMLFVACVGFPMSIYLSHTNQDQGKYVYAATSIPSDINSDRILNILDYNLLLDYKDQTTLNRFIGELRTQTNP